ELLDGKKPGGANNQTVGEDYVAAILKDSKQPVLFRTLALRSLRADHPLLTPALLSTLLKTDDEAVKREVVRALMVRDDSGAQRLLREIAADQRLPEAMRKLAITGLGHSIDSNPTLEVLNQLSLQPRFEFAARRFRDPPGPVSNRGVADWRKVLA